MRRGLLWLVPVAVVCGLAPWWLLYQHRQSPNQLAIAGITVPDPDTSEMEPRVAQRVREARQAVLEQPGSVEAWGRLGKVFDIHRLYEEAVPCYRRAGEPAPNDFRWAYFQARVLELQFSDLDEVIDQFRAASRLRPSYAPLYVRLGDALMRNGQYEEARDAYARALERDDSLLRAHRGLSQALLALGDTAGAVSQLQRVAQGFPHDGATFAELARAYSRGGDRDRAREAAAKAQELTEDHALPEPLYLEVLTEGISLFHCLRRAEQLMQAGRYEQAIPDLKIIESLRPNEAYVQTQLATAYMQTGRIDSAIRHFERAIALGTRTADVYAKLGRLHVQQRRRDDAIAAFRRAVELEPTNAHHHYNLGVTLMNHGDIESALERFRAALRLKPDYANAHFNLGIGLERLGRVDEAIEHYRRAVQIDPNHQAVRRLGQLGSAPR